MARLILLILPLLALLATPALAKDSEWGPGVTYTTDWKKAIAMAQATGKMLFIYNGWKNKGI